MNADRAALDAVRQDEGAFAAALDALGMKIKGRSVTCPQHDDKTPSASILNAADGAWRVHCHVCDKGWDVFDLREMAGGRPVADQIRDVRQATKPPALRVIETRKPVLPDLEAVARVLPKVEDTFTYANPTTGAAELVVYRCRLPDGKKTFRQASPVAGGWALEAPPKPWPLYNRARVLAADAVVVVEGEKCVHALHGIGIVATTSPCGAGKAGEADWSPLAGKRVYLWPDNDPADPKTKKRVGIEHMRGVAKMLETVHPAPSAYWIEPDGLGLPDKGDVADLLEAMDAASTETCVQTINGILADAEPLIGASRTVDALIEDTIAGKRRAIPWPWQRMSELSKALLPGTVTVLCGDAGSTKSFLLLEAMAFWHEQGERVAIFELEEDRPYHLYRALTQRCGDGRLFDDEWVMKNPEVAREAARTHRPFLDSFGRCMWEAPNEQLTLKALAEWAKERAQAGVRIIAIDPVTAAKSEAKPWAEDLTFLMSVKATAREFACSVLLVTHPRTGAKAGALNEMAGGAAYPRFAQTVLWLEAYAQPKSLAILSGESVKTQVVNRCIAIRKARNGKGSGLKIAYQFDGRTLRFAEVGVVHPKEPKQEESKPGDRFQRMGSQPAEGEDRF